MYNFDKDIEKMSPEELAELEYNFVCDRKLGVLRLSSSRNGNQISYPVLQAKKIGTSMAMCVVESRVEVVDYEKTRPMEIEEMVLLTNTAKRFAPDEEMTMILRELTRMTVKIEMDMIGRKFESLRRDLELL